MLRRQQVGADSRLGTVRAGRGGAAPSLFPEFMRPRFRAGDTVHLILKPRSWCWCRCARCGTGRDPAAASPAVGSAARLARALARPCRSEQRKNQLISFRRGHTAPRYVTYPSRSALPGRGTVVAALRATRPDAARAVSAALTARRRRRGGARRRGDTAASGASPPCDERINQNLHALPRPAGRPSSRQCARSHAATRHPNTAEITRAATSKTGRSSSPCSLCADASQAGRAGPGRGSSN